MENNLEKGIKDLGAGPAVKTDKYGTKYDYSHLLSPENRALGYNLSVYHAKHEDDEMESLMAMVGNSRWQPETGPGGFLQTFIHPKGLKVDHASLNSPHRGKGLGTNMYEAVYAHAKNHLGINRAIGGVHSSLAHAAHERLAQKHGLDYRAKRIGPTSHHGEYDQAYNKYSYTLKSEQPLEKAEVDHSTIANSESASAQAGLHGDLASALAAAAFLAAGAAPAPNLHTLLWENDGDVHATALQAYGLPVTDQLRQALQAIELTRGLTKAEPPPPPQVQSVLAATHDGDDIAQAVQRAFRDHFVFEVMLSGKHSNGTLLAHDEETHATWLLKPGSGGQSTASGADEDPSTQSDREAAFYQVAKMWGLYDAFPRAELLLLDGKQYAALEFLGTDYKTVEKRRDTDPNICTKLFLPHLNDGTLHQWAVLDFVAGNPDRHGQNIMVDDEGKLKLIDHGSAFAGPDFDPGHDRNSFVPYYLRAWAPRAFNKLPQDEKLEYLPRVSAPVAASLYTWLNGLHAEELEHTLYRYGVNPTWCLARLAQVKAMVTSGYPVDQAINKLWILT